jgi:hypothetical protein
MLFVKICWISNPASNVSLVKLSDRMREPCCTSVKWFKKQSDIMINSVMYGTSDK